MSGREKRKGSAVWQRILLVVIALIIGAGVYLFNARRLVGDPMPMPFGFGAAVVLSGSMEPTLAVDDLVLVKRCGEYAPGDVVVYQSGGSLVIHRIMEIDGETVITQGDANNAPDEPFPKTDIRGRLVGKIGGVGRVISSLGSPIGIICTLLLALVLFALSCRKERTADEEKLAELQAEIDKIKAEQNEEKRDETKE